MRKNNPIFVFILIIVIAGIAFIASKLFNSENNTPFSLDGTVVEILDEGKDVLEIQREEILQNELSALIDNWSREMLGVNGWLHVVTSHDRDKNSTSTLSSGQIIPEDYIMDSWYFLNGEGLVSKAVTLMTDQTGNILQVSIYSEETWINLMGEETLTAPPFSIELDFEIRKDLTRYSETGLSIVSSQSTYDGYTVDVFGIYSRLNEPISVEGYNSMIIGGGRKAYFDTGSGALLAAERFLNGVDGSIYLLEKVSYTTLENVNTPPDRILAYLNKE